MHSWNSNHLKVTFDDFCDQLKKGTLSHETWFRNQQKKGQVGDLSEDRFDKLTTVLCKGWERDNITALRNSVRCGDIGIMETNDFTKAVASIPSDGPGLEQ